MRRLVVLFSVLLLGTCWAAAQDNSHKTNPYSPTQASKDASGQTTVEGCLSGAAGDFMLSDKNGTTYKLTGDTAKLSEHVGHEVKITGTASSGNDGGTASGTSGAVQTLEVTSMKHIAKTCKNVAAPK
jgi:hypothetical protein